jgi:putative transposase
MSFDTNLRLFTRSRPARRRPPYLRAVSYPLRSPAVGNVLHVRTRATGHEPLFRDHWDYEGMLWLLGREVLRHELGCLNYCLMPNHIHLVLRPKRETVPAALRDLLSSYARRFNERWERRGHLVECRYRSTPARDDPHVYRMMRYVALNPVTADLCDRPEAWPYSGYAALLGLRDAPIWLDVMSALQLFDREPSRARREYRAFVEKRPS